MTSVFKVWSSDRSRKIAFVAPCTVQDVIATANKKLNITGTGLFLESDGTEIEDNDVLHHFSAQPFIILEAGKVWKENSRNSTLDGNDLAPENATLFHNDIAEIPAIADVNIDNREFVQTHDNVVAANERDVNLNIWFDYNYNWQNLDSSYITQLQNGESTKSVKTEVVHKVILQMRQISMSIPSTVFRRVAKSIMETFPNSFEDRKNGKRYGNGYTVLYDTLKNHNNYLDRLLKAEGSVSQKRKVPANKARYLMQAKLGATNWQPVEHPEGESDVTVEEKRQNLISLNRLLQMGQLTPALHAEILTELTASFKTIREFFNDIHDLPTPDTLYLSWPVLYSKEYFCHLYHLQMGHPIELLKENLKRDALSIFSFGRANNLTSSNTPEDDYEIICIIFKYFGENITHLINQCPVSFNLKVLFFCQNEIHPGHFTLTIEFYNKKRKITLH